MSAADSQPLRLYGAKISMFTGKVRSYLIKQNIPFIEISPTDTHYQKVIVPQIGRRIVPVVELADGQILQDSSDIIDALDATTLSKRKAYPKDPLKRLLSLILEFYGDEGLMRPAMHYRWNFSEQTHTFITHGFGGSTGPEATAEQRAQVKASIDKFSGFLPMLGITPESKDAIEHNYKKALTVFDTHFVRHPYILGAYPTLGDYGLMCSLYAHLGRDPVPAGLMKNHAPNLYRWTERMNVSHDDISDMPYYQANDDIPETLKAVFQFIAESFLPEVKAAVSLLNALPPQQSGERASLHPKFYVLGQMTFEQEGVPVSCAVRPMLFYMLARVQKAYHSLSDQDRASADEYLSTTGLMPLVSLKMNKTVTRHNFQEVWA